MMRQNPSVTGAAREVGLLDVGWAFEGEELVLDHLVHVAIGRMVIWGTHQSARTLPQDSYMEHAAHASLGPGEMRVLVLGAGAGRLTVEIFILVEVTRIVQPVCDRTRQASPAVPDVQVVW